jgi:hypothetical protein
MSLDAITFDWKSLDIPVMDGCQSKHARLDDSRPKENSKSRLTKDRACWGASPRNAETADMLGCVDDACKIQSDISGPGENGAWLAMMSPLSWSVLVGPPRHW